ncbi:acyltransferase [Methyloterricola oryzae]|uniref:acyltransferase n=1 Tax=Methyloterricola oryzae TaxID=1495050 RepID=UPI00069B4E10|nr:acyltransferase [Methyloterricola oryzae]
MIKSIFWNFISLYINIKKRLILLKFCIIYRLYRLAGEENKYFEECSYYLSRYPGLWGMWIRMKFYAKFMPGFSKNPVYLSQGVHICRRSVEIGEGTYVGANCNFGGGKIGRMCLIADNVQIIPGRITHGFADKTKLMHHQPGKYEHISIGDDTWLGTGAIIMANVGTGCVIGAGSVVTRDIPDYSVAVGVPARVIKTR